MFNSYKTRNRWALLIVIFLSITSVFVQARTDELVDPAPVKIPEGLTLEQINNAVNAALRQKSWKVERIVSESPRVIEVEYRIRSHIMALNLEYTPENIIFSYNRSENLNYKVTRKKTIIHPNYMVWRQQLADQIKNNFASGEYFTASASVPTSTPATAPTSTTAAYPIGALESDLPKEPFSAYGQFKFEPTTLAGYLAKEKTAITTSTNLDHNITVAVQPKLSVWNKPDNPRTLQIKTHISALRFIGGGTRFFAGRMAGRSNITVEVTFIDQATSTVIGKKVISRIAEAANGFTLARADYAMVENMGKDIVSYIDKHYEAPRNSN